MTEPVQNDVLTMSDLAGNITLRAYLRNVRDWHGYIRFLGLPDRRDNPDVLIDRLFVEPLLTRRHVSPDEDPTTWLPDAQTIFDVLRRHRPLVLLGDPGTGKSTLLNYLVWLLARPTVHMWSKHMGPWLLPIPMMLRELRLHDVTSFDGLLRAFLDHPVGRALRGDDYVITMLQQGRAFVLLDGIDELSGVHARLALRTAVLDGIVRYPECRWLLTSRIVGYDEMPFDSTPRARRFANGAPPHPGGPAEALPPSSGTTHTRTERRGFDGLDRDREVENDAMTRRYMAPFDDTRITHFSRNWYDQREAAASRAGRDAAHLVRAVHADTSILRLARVPNLLTMMALIHRVEATLPHGRALLYDRIAEAYLESIDKFRGVYSSAHNLAQKKRWLGRVAYELQKRRATTPPDALAEAGSELLAEVTDVIEWLTEEMGHGDPSRDMSAQEFLDFVGRRSGLFLPRAEGRYAFVHLSFQEYFAAVALEREVTGVAWATGERTRLGLMRGTFIEWAEHSAWRETLAFLFELLVDRDDWYRDLLVTMFGQGFSRLEGGAGDGPSRLGELLARLVVNPRSGIRQDQQPRALVAIIRTALRAETTWEGRPRTPGGLASLLGDDPDWNAKVLGSVVDEMELQGVVELSLARTGISDLGPLGRAVWLKGLDVARTRISDLAPLANMVVLVALDSDRTGVSDLSPLRNLGTLEYLSALGTQVGNVAPLADLHALKYLHLGSTRVINLDPLASLVGLTQLYLGETAVRDVRPLASLVNLTRLGLPRTNVRDLRPLAGLSGLVGLYLGRSRVQDLSPLATLKRLKRVAFWETSVRDLGPLAEVTGLRMLEAARTGVRSIEALAARGSSPFAEPACSSSLGTSD